jgi:hypothetical protein
VTTTEPFMTDAELQKSWPQWGPSLQRFGALVGRPKPVCLLTPLAQARRQVKFLAASD